MSDNYAVFNQIAKSVLKQPTLAKKELVRLFLEIERHIFEGINLLLHHTSFVEDNLCYALSEIATGLIKSRKIYRGKRIKKRVYVGCGMDMGVENFRILSVGFDLFKLSKVDRTIAAPLTKRIIRALDLNTYVYENILRAFVKETNEYCETAHTAAEMAADAQRENLDRVAVQDRTQHLRDAMESTETNVGCTDTHRLYGVVYLLRELVKTISVLQTKIISSYQRMILSPAKNRAMSDSEALDLFQAGNLGLSRAASLFDVDSKAGFQTIAGWWIKQQIFKSSKFDNPLIRLSPSVWEAHMKIRAAERAFEADPTTRYIYTDADIANALGKTVRSIQKVREKVQSVRLVSLDDLVRKEDGSDSEIAVESVLVDGRIEDQEALKETQEWVASVLYHLDPEEQRMVCLRFGLVDSIKNNQLSSVQVVREVLKQAACKAATYLYVTAN